MQQNSATGRAAVVGGLALSPWTDLTLSGDSWSTGAGADPLLHEAASRRTRAFLSGWPHFGRPLASPLYANCKGLAPIPGHVGSAEVLLDDSVRLSSAIAAGVDARLDVWAGMAHGHLGAVGRLAVSAETLQLVGHFLTERLTNAELEQ